MSSGDEAPLSRENLLAQLSIVASMRSSEAQVLWAIHGVFWAFNGILLVALFSTGGFPKPAASIPISAVGIFMSLVWHMMQRRTVGYLNKHEALMHRIESIVFVGRNAKYAISNEEDRKLHLSKRPTSRGLMQIVGFVFSAGWTAALLLAVSSLL